MPLSFSFADAVRSLGANAGFRIMNQRPGTDYLFETLLPEMPKTDYNIVAGSLIIRTTMAGLVGTSSPYPPGGIMEARQFLEKSAKIAIEVTLEEDALREIQAIIRDMMVAGSSVTEQNAMMVQEALNFMEKVVKQAHDDTREWLRGRALIDGSIDWKFNGKHLVVDYKLPAGFIHDQRSGADGYAGATSKFWADHYTALAQLRYDIRAIITHPTTWQQIANNDANKFELSQTGPNAYVVRRYRTRGNGETISGDGRDMFSLLTYDREGEIINPDYNQLDSTSPKTLIVRMVEPGEILYVANSQRSGYRVGEGATPDPARAASLGYTHIAPTVEAGGAPGVWGDMYTPDEAPWSLVGRGAENSLPVREDVTKVLAKTVTLKTTLPIAA